MKNNWISIIIGLMLFSTIGIIWIQSIWISNSIDARKKDFASHVFDALNEVNKSIEEDESIFILEQQFGSADSILDELMFFNEFLGPDSANQVHIVEEYDNGAERVEIKIEQSNDSVLVETRTDQRSHGSGVWVENGHTEDVKRRVHRRRHEGDQSDARGARVERQEERVKQRKLKKIKSMVRHYSYEKLIGGDLEQRLSPQMLDEKINAALLAEGIDADVEYGVFNLKKKSFEPKFVTDEFNPRIPTPFKRMLFPRDRLSDGIELQLQTNALDGYVWQGIQKMTLLSVLFTLLILSAFGASLYFIFKQKKVSQIKNDFINNMTHELKTPLASISLANASIVHPEVIGKPEEIKRYSNIIRAEENRMNAHVERVLDMAAVDTNELKLQQEPLNLIEVVEKAKRNIDLCLNDVGGSIAFDSEVDSAIIQGDEFHLINVVTNVMDNSVKYSDHAPKIRVLLKQVSNAFVLTVQDNGIGMSSKEQKLAFDRFYRAETGNIHNRKGFGLGLSYVKTIVEKHGGAVRLESEKDKGTKVQLQFPIKS